MKKAKVIEHQGFKTSDFEQTKVFINSLLDSGTTVRYREVNRRRAIPSMLTFPHKESPHF